jgi:uncharacterized membrane protein YhhN
MNATAFLLVVLALVVAVTDWIAVHRGARLAEYACKPATMAFLIAGVVAMDPRDSGVQWWFVVALSLSLVGDVLLMLPRDLFVQGLSAFLLAHVAYIVGLHLDGIEAIPFLGGVVAAMLLLAIVGRRILQAIRLGEDPKLAGPVVAYMFVIAAMAASAIGTTRVTAGAGAVLFVTSDALIAWNRFIHEQRYGRLAIITTYHVGQLLLALSVAG